MKRFYFILCIWIGLGLWMGVSLEAAKPIPRIDVEQLTQIFNDYVVQTNRERIPDPSIHDVRAHKTPFRAPEKFVKPPQLHRTIP